MNPSHDTASAEAARIHVANEALPPRIHPFFVCPACGGDLLSNDGVHCASCGIRYAENDQLLSLNVDGAHTALDEIDYDAVYRVDAGSSAHVVGSCLRILGDRLPSRIKNFLEFGAGTGLFTLGFLQQVPVEHAVITDISAEMLSICRRRLDDAGVMEKTEVEFATWDGDRSCLRPGSFDLIAGFSVVHHVLDYAKLFRHLQLGLTHDGFALFLEPNYRFHTVLIDFVVDILCNIPPENAIWTPSNRNAVLCWLYENHTNLRFRGDAQMLADREDKHLFDGAELRRAACLAGFADVELIPFGNREECFSAIQVYAAQLGLTADARSDLIERFARQLPGAFAHLAEEDRAPSFLILLHNSLQKHRPIETTPEFVPRQARACFQFDLHVVVTLESTGANIQLRGWVLGDLDANYVSLRCGERQKSYAIHQMRPDVQAAINSTRIYPLRRAVFSGVDSSHRYPVQSPHASIELHVCAADGQEYLLASIPLKAGTSAVSGQTGRTDPTAA